MVTRTVIRVTSSEAEHWVAMAAAAAVGDNSAAVKKDNNDEQSNSSKSSAATSDKKDVQLQKRHKKLCSHPSCNKRAQHSSTLCWRHGAKDVVCSFDGCNKKGILLGLCPDHGGLVQLCRWKGCINKVNLERRGGMCWMHQEDSADSDDSEDEESEDDGEIRLCRFKGCISVTTGGEMCIRHSTTYDGDCLDQAEGKKKKRSLSSWDIADNETTIKRRRQQNNPLVIDLSDVPAQPPIPKSSGHVKEGASKYTGVSFIKKSNKWVAQIMIEGKQHCIGYYDNEEDAAVDYARALFKYKGGVEGQDHRASVIDLNGVPPQPPIPKSSRRIKEGASKYTGVTFNKQSNRWHAQIGIGGKNQFIGLYDNEEEAAVDYARAVFKYKGGVKNQK